MNKLLYSVLIIPITFLSFSFAIDTGTNDCSILTIKNGEYEFLPKGKYESILPQNALEKSFDNLRAACCKRDVQIGSCDGIDKNGIFPDSVFLFDHLLDIYLRRLDANGENDNGKDLLYGLQPDEKGKEWRNAINKIGSDIEGLPPLQIEQLYKTYRSGNIYIEPKYNDNNTQINPETRKSNISGAISNFENRTLIDRYNNACDLITYIYLDITKNMTHLNGNNNQNSQNQLRLQRIYNSCSNLINNRKSSERIYAEVIAQNKGNIFINNNISTYLNTHFLNNNLQKLQSTIHNRQFSFAEVVKSINKLVNECS